MYNFCLERKLGLNIFGKSYLLTKFNCFVLNVLQYYYIYTKINVLNIIQWKLNGNII